MQAAGERRGVPWSEAPNRAPPLSAFQRQRPKRAGRQWATAIAPPREGVSGHVRSREIGRRERRRVGQLGTNAAPRLLRRTNSRHAGSYQSAYRSALRGAEFFHGCCRGYRANGLTCQAELPPPSGSNFPVPIFSTISMTSQISMPRYRHYAFNAAVPKQQLDCSKACPYHTPQFAS